MIPKVKRQELHKGSSLFPGVRGAKQKCQPSTSNPGELQVMFVKADLKEHLEMSHAEQGSQWGFQTGRWAALNEWISNRRWRQLGYIIIPVALPWKPSPAFEAYPQSLLTQ